MPLTDEHAGVMNTLGEPRFKDLGLETTLQKVLDLERKHIIETHTGLVEHTNAD